jgi:hypothetical protein
LNIGWNLPTACLSAEGDTELLFPYQSFLTREAYLRTRTPLVPRGLSSLMSSKNLLERKYSVKAIVLARHWTPEFMKQVLPRFYRPQTPSTDDGWRVMTFIDSSSEADFSHFG